MNIVDIILDKRYGRELSDDQIGFSLKELPTVRFLIIRFHHF